MPEVLAVQIQQVQEAFKDTSKKPCLFINPKTGLLSVGFINEQGTLNAEDTFPIEEK